MRAAVDDFSCVTARRKCSVDTYSSLKSSAALNAASNTLRSDGAIIGSADAPPTFENFVTSLATSASIVAGFWPSLLRIGATMPPSWRSSAKRRCSGVASGFPAPRARFCASTTASCALTVSLLKFMVCLALSQLHSYLQTCKFRHEFRRCKKRARLTPAQAEARLSATSTLESHQTRGQGRERR